MKMPEEELKRLLRCDLTDLTIRILSMLINSSNMFFVRESEREKADRKKFSEYLGMEGDFNLFLAIYNQFMDYYGERKN